MEGEEPIVGAGDYQSADYQIADWNSQPPIDYFRKKEKLHSALIIIIGVFAILFGAVSLWVSVANPFASLIKIGQQQDQLALKQQQAQLAAQQAQDTDGDGLSDYDEINIYHTSPYLKDTDSDGIDDKTEIQQGTDPNCPQGQTCFNGTPYTPTAGAASSSVPTLDATAPSSATTPSQQITPDFVRNLMIQSGATQDFVNSLSDADVMADFNTFLQNNPDLASQISGNGSAAATTPAPAVNTSAGSATTTQLSNPDVSKVDLNSLNVKSASDLQNLTGAQIRQLMIQSGASAAVLAAVSDDQLKSMFLSQLQSQTASGQ